MAKWRLTLFHFSVKLYHSASPGSRYALLVILASSNKASRLSTSGARTSSSSQSNGCRSFSFRRDRNLALWKSSCERGLCTFRLRVFTWWLDDDAAEYDGGTSWNMIRDSFATPWICRRWKVKGPVGVGGPAGGLENGDCEVPKSERMALNTGQDESISRI